MTKPTALSDDSFDATSFLAISRQFFGLTATVSNRPTIVTNRYRKVARSLLLATGLGAFIPGQAFASQESWNISDREACQEPQAELPTPDQQ